MTLFEDFLLIWLAISNGMILAGLIAINETLKGMK